MSETIDQPPYQVFLCHAESDVARVRELYERLTQEGMEAWLSEEKLLPGQDRELEIRKAVSAAEAVVICLSGPFNEAGPQQKEARLALDTALEQPEGEIFIVPARLEPCELPYRLKKYERVDLFEEGGYERLLRALKLDAQRKTAPLPREAPEPQDEEQADHTEAKPQPRWRKYLDVLGILLALLAFLFGDNLYAQLTGHPIFDDPPTPTPTMTATAIRVLTSTISETPASTPTLTPTLTFTPVPPTETPSLTPTITVVPPVPLGKDWLAGCISKLWEIYPATVLAVDHGNGCWSEPLYVFSAENGDLDVLTQRGQGSAETYGLFAQLPARGTVTFTVRLRDLYNVDLLMGVFAEPDSTSKGLLMIIPHGDVSQCVIVQKDPQNYDKIDTTVPIDQGSGYLFSFTFTELSVRGKVGLNTYTFGPLSLPTEQKWLFLGYKGLFGYYSLDGTFLQFDLKP